MDPNYPFFEISGSPYVTIESGLSCGGDMAEPQAIHSIQACTDANQHYWKIGATGLMALVLVLMLMAPSLIKISIYNQKDSVDSAELIHRSNVAFDQGSALMQMSDFTDHHDHESMFDLLAEDSQEDQEEEESLPPYHYIILQAADRHDIDPALIRAVIMAESSYNPNAISRSGAKGLMQLMPRTAKALGVEDILNPEHNINGGVKYLRQMLNRFNGDLKLALAAYNAGSRHVKRYRGVPPFKETRNYIKKVLNYYEDYRKEMAEMA